MKLATDLVLMRHPSPLGSLTLAATPRGLAGLWFDGQRHLPDLTHLQTTSEHPLLLQAAGQLDRYWRGHRTTFDLPLDLTSGTAFQQRVWLTLLTIGFGETRRYRELAADIGHPNAARAVGSAVGRNPLSVIVPCHRIVGSDGSLTGYAGGLERKRHLLALEGIL